MKQVRLFRRAGRLCATAMKLSFHSAFVSNGDGLVGRYTPVFFVDLC